jgi:hypothetical protein
MRGAWMGFGLVGLVLLVWGAGIFPEAAAQRPGAVATPNVVPAHHASDRGQPGELLALSMDVEGRQQITVVDPRRQVMAVYHIDRNSGSITLRSVRNVQWDMVMEDFNSGNPTPREIRSIADQR